MGYSAFRKPSVFFLLFIFMLKKHKTDNGTIVRAGLDWGNIYTLSVADLNAHGAWSVRIHSEVPRLTVPRPIIVDCSTAPEQLGRAIDLAWLAAGKVTQIDTRYAKPVKVSKSVLEGLALLEKHRFDVWHWALYSLITHWGKRTPTKQIWFGVNKVSEHIKRAKTFRPPESGWVMPTKNSIELIRLRNTVWDAILASAKDGLQACELAANSICSEEEFQRRLDRLSSENASQLVAINKQIPLGKWPWPRGWYSEEIK